MTIHPDGSRDILVHGQQGRLLELMQQIADEAAETTITANSALVPRSVGWCRPYAFRIEADKLERAMEYLRLRGIIEVVEDEYEGKLVRFTERDE